MTAIIAIALAIAGCDRSQNETATDAGSTTTTSTDEEANAEAPDEAEAADSSATCEQAYADLEELVKGLEEQLGPSDAGMPEREAFIEKCQTLPADVQKCMVFEYGMAHKEECEERVSKLDPEAQRRAQELMGK